MPKYRYTQVEFWDDADIEKMSFEEKSFYIYLLTNPRTTQCGIYNFSLGISSIQLNLNKDKVVELLNKLISYGKVLYDVENSELMIVNWYKYNITTFMEIQELESFLEDLGEELVLLAINEAVKNNVRNMRYINTLLIDWRNQCFKTSSEVLYYIKIRKKKFNKSEPFEAANAGAYRIVEVEE